MKKILFTLALAVACGSAAAQDQIVNRRYEFHPQPEEASRPKQRFRLRYQGEAAIAFGLGVGTSHENNTNRLSLETVHGVRFSPYFFTGLGIGYNYLYSEVIFYDQNSYYTIKGVDFCTYFVNTKVYHSLSDICLLYLSLDLGITKGTQGYFSGTHFYTATGPGVLFRNDNSFGRADLSIRFQRLGRGMNALLFRFACVF